MRSTIVRQFTVGLVAIATVAAGLVPSALAQSPKSVVSGLQEDQDKIRACRQVNQRAAVFDNTNLWPIANRLGTLDAGERVKLTGVVLLGRAQIFIENDFFRLGQAQPVGWISSGVLGPCGSPISPVSRVCFRADVDLRVRPTRSLNDNGILTYRTNDIFVASTNPPLKVPSNNLSWLEVTMNDGTYGWVVETMNNGQRNATQINCP
jgi:hypothetical protein